MNLSLLNFTSSFISREPELVPASRCLLRLIAFSEACELYQPMCKIFQINIPCGLGVMFSTDTAGGFAHLSKLAFWRNPTKVTAGMGEIIAAGIKP